MNRMFSHLAMGFGALALAAGMGMSAQAWAQDQNTGDGPRPFSGRRGPMGPGGRGGPLGPGLALRGLDLTDAQRQQIRTLMESNREQLQPLLERAAQARRALEAAVTADVFDEGTIRSRHAELAAAEVDLAVARARTHADVLQILTPEQRAEQKKIEAQREERRGNRRR